MLLKKTEQQGKIKALYLSSNICASIYDKENKDLIIIYKNGGQYKYPTVSLTDYTRFELADSQGAVFNSHLKKYAHLKLDRVDTAEIMNEVNELKEAEDKKMLEDATILMIHQLQSVLTMYHISGNIDGTILDKAEKAIQHYKGINK